MPGITNISDFNGEVGNVPGGNYAEFEDDGFIEFHGDGRYWMDFNFGCVDLGTGATAPDLIALGAGGTIYIRGFDGGVTTEQLFGSFELNHNWAEGIVLKPHVHWVSTTADAGNVKWQLTYSLVADGAVAGVGATIPIISAAPGVAWTSVFAAFPDIATAGLHIGTQVSFRLFRDPTDGDDNYPGDAGLFTFGVHVLCDTVGSRAVSSK